MSDVAPSPVGAMFGRIAGVYDLLNHLLSLGIDRKWRKELAGLTIAGQTGVIVDLAAGTLDVALAILKVHPEATVPALDFCPQMLLHGKRKLMDNTRLSRIVPVAADALCLPLKDGCADSITMAFGIRNIPQRDAAFAEMRRILAPGGRVCILEFGSGRERVWGGIYNCYLKYALPALGAMVARDASAYSYLSRTIMAFPAAAQLAAEMEAAGFENVGWRKLTSGIVCLHWGTRP